MSLHRFFAAFTTHSACSICECRATVPAVYDCEESGWALPCSPYGGKGVGFFFIPSVGSNVWMEFENGDPDYPIWVGCFWDEGESPNLPALPSVKTIKTDSATQKLTMHQRRQGQLR